MMKVGDKAPDFSLEDSEGVKRKLSDYKGKKVVLYFYPKDFTPGCTEEACNFRDSILTRKTVVIGISADSPEKHRKFADKFELPFMLLSDPEKKVIKKYGSLRSKKMFGRTFLGIQRSTFIIDEKGNIARIFSKVSVRGHVEEVISSL